MTESSRMLPADVALAQRIRAVRIIAKKTQREVAEALKMSDPAYYKIEAGRSKVSYGKIAQICSALNISIFTLLAPLGEGGDGRSSDDLYRPLLESPHTMEMLLEWDRIKQPELRALLVQLLRWITKRRL